MTKDRRYRTIRLENFVRKTGAFLFVTLIKATNSLKKKRKGEKMRKDDTYTGFDFRKREAITFPVKQPVIRNKKLNPRWDSKALAICSGVTLKSLQVRAIWCIGGRLRNKFKSSRFENVVVRRHSQ